LKKLLAVLRQVDAIAPQGPVELSPRERIFEDFAGYLARERGLARGTIVGHLPAVRLFLQEMGIERTGDLARLDQAAVIGFIERHALDHSPATAKKTCCALRAFLQYLRWEGWTLVDLAGSGFGQVSRQPTRCSGSSLSMECQPLWFSRILARDLTEPARPCFPTINRPFTVPPRCPIVGGLKGEYQHQG
jgi:hypothetical protein